MKYKRKIIINFLLLLVFVGFTVRQMAYLDIGISPQQILESGLPKEQKSTPKEHNLGSIRVLLKSNGYAGVTHEKVKVKAKGGLAIQSASGTQNIKGGKTVSFMPDDKRFEGGSIRIMSQKTGVPIQITTLKRGYGTPRYEGILELYTTAEGIVVVNELKVEQYLERVVPSEMPATYELEALKAQAVCARNYAYNQKKNYGYPQYKAHVDDSTAYQVYNNSAVNTRTKQAVRETKGQLLVDGKKIVTTYYYSTSSGKSTDVKAWGTKKTKANQYLTGISICDERGVDYEKDLPWYRWWIEVPQKEMKELLELNAKSEIGVLQDIFVSKYGAGGVALELLIKGSKKELTIKTEYEIRSILGSSRYTIHRQDGSKVEGSNLLPSAFITIRKKGGIYRIAGGGYGHGIGLSQNGANEMAKTGKTYEEILKFFYTGTKLQ